MRSLRRTLLLALGLSLVFTLALLWWVADQRIRTLSEGLVGNRLMHDGESLVAAMEWVEGRLQVEPQRLGLIYQRPFSGHYYQVESQGEVLHYSRSLWDNPLPTQPLPVGEVELQRLSGPLDHTLLAYRFGVEKQGHDLTVVVAEDLTPLQEQLEHFHLSLALITLVVLLLLLLAQRLVVRATTAPLDALRDQLRALRKGERHSLDSPLPVELAPLQQEINRLLGLLDERLQRSRNATGNLAHALKAPLSLLTQLFDDPRLLQHPDLQQALQGQLERMRQLMERELRRARLAGGHHPGQLFDPKAALDDLAELLSRIYAERHLRITRQVPTDLGGLPFDREDMLELCGNLLDNAAKWARREVVVTLQREADTLQIRVGDDGPGCPDAQLDQLTRRGNRVDEATAGHGLGLAIVADVVRLYHGRIGFTRDPTLGGLCVTIHLPLTPVEGG